MTMIERVARASHDFFRPIYMLPPFDDLPEASKSVMFQHARSILAAMEAPSPAIEAVRTASIDYGSGEVWRMFVKGVLVEKAA